MDEQDPLPEQPSRRWWIPSFVLVLSLATTAAATGFVWRTAGVKDGARFDIAAERTRLAVSNRMDVYSASIRNVTALFETAGIPSPKPFHEYLGRLDVGHHYPGLEGIGFSFRFAAKDRDLVAKTGREKVSPSFHLWPEDPPREDYHTVAYLEPTDDANRRMVGFDLHTDPVRAAAMDAARDAAAPAASGRVELPPKVGATEPRAGFLVFMPLYKDKVPPTSVEDRRARLFGYIYATFAADDLLRNLYPEGTNAEVDFQLYDGHGADPAALLHDSSRFRPARAGRPRYSKLQQIDVAGRPWTVRVVTRPEFERASGRWVTPMVLTLGGLVSLTFFGLTRSQVTALLAGRRAMADLRRSERERERQAARELEASKAEARRRAFFLNALSHDLRTPLNGVVLQAAVAKLSLEAGDAAGLGESMSQIEASVAAIRDLLDALLDAAREDGSGDRNSPSVFALDELLARVAAAAQAAAERKGLALRADVPPGLHVRTDRVKLERILLNLVDNAVKFTEVGSVHVDVERSGTGVSVHVVDTGVGVSPEHRARLFDEFYQVGNPERDRRKGFGLGLAIARRLAQQLGGDLAAGGAAGGGTRFTVSLPGVVEDGRPGPGPQPVAGGTAPAAAAGG